LWHTKLHSARSSAEQNQRDGEDKKMEHYVHGGKMEAKFLAKFFRENNIRNRQRIAKNKEKKKNNTQCCSGMKKQQIFFPKQHNFTA